MTLHVEHQRQPETNVRKSLSLLFGMVVVAALGTTLPASAQHYPSHPVRFINSGGPGTGSDLLTRAFAERFRVLTGQPTIVENRNGGNTIIATQALLSSRADGHTVLVLTSGSMFLTPLTQPVPYTVDQLQPIISLSRHSGILVASPKSDFKTVADIVQAAKARPGDVAIGAYGVHFKLWAKVFEQRAGVQMNVVPYAGPMQMHPGLIEGSVPLAFTDLGTALPLIASGKLRPIAVGTEGRSPLLPAVPTMVESGYPRFVVNTFLGFGVRSTTPAPIAQKLEALMLEVIADPEFLQAARQVTGAEITGLAARPFAHMIASEAAQYGEMLKSVGGVVPQ